MALHEQAASAAVPASLAAATVGSAMPTGVVPAAVEGLAREVLRAMFLTRLRMAAGTTVAMMALITGAGVLARQGADPGPPGEREGDRPETGASGREAPRTTPPRRG